MLDLYRNIKQKRLEHGWNQTELAARMNYCDKSMISKIEAGKVDLSRSKILEFANVLGCTASELMGDVMPQSDLISEAMDLYNQYQKLSPENQIAFRTLLKSLQSES